MNRNYYDEMRFLRLLEHIRWYERRDLILKMSLFAVLFSSLLYAGSLPLACSFAAVMAAAKVLGALLAGTFWLILRKWFNPVFHKIYPGTPCVDKLGPYSLAEIRSMIAGISRELDVLVPEELVLYESKLANAFAVKRDCMGLCARRRITLLTNLFHILDPLELRAVIAHEIGHHKHFPRVGLCARLLAPLFAARPSYRQCLEHLSDWYAAKVAGIVPASNALIKVRHRGYLISELFAAIVFVQKELKGRLGDVAEFLEIANNIIPAGLKAAECLDKHIADTIDSYFEKHGDPRKGQGKKFAENYRKDKDVKLKRRVLKSNFKSIDWRVFDDRIRDDRLDDLELENLYLHLKRNPAADIFPSREAERRRQDRLSHPPLRERLIFMIEAVQPAPSANTSVEEGRAEGTISGPRKAARRNGS